MKKVILIQFTCLILFLLSCKKSKMNIPCGCNENETITYTADKMVGTLGYVNSQYQKAWFVNVKFPDNSVWLCKICNVDKAQNIISTISATDTVSVKFSGRLRNFCSGEYIGYYTGIVVPLHLVIDSIKRN